MHSFAPPPPRARKPCVDDVKRTAYATLRKGTSLFRLHGAEMEKLIAEHDQRGFHKHLKGTAEMGGNKVIKWTIR